MIGKLYKSCYELPLNRFIDALVNGNIRALVKYGYFNQKRIVSAWESIFQEYLDLSKDTSHTYMLNMAREYGVLANKISIVKDVVKLLSIRRHDGLISVLKSLGFNYRFTDETMKKDLENVIARAKTWVFRANKVEKQIIEQPKSDGVKQADFDEILSELSSFQGYHVNASKITVSEYISMLNRFKKYLEDGKRRKDNRTNRR